jgi:hypothetical protein
LRRAFPHATERLAFQPREGFEYLRPRLIANGWPGDAAPPVSPMPESRP